jgi:chemotaxis protein CheD
VKPEMNKAVTYHLEPGFVYVSAKGAVIRTVVGSCVAVCLWDSRLMVGGMNHFIYPVTGRHDPRTTSYGNVALHVLVKMMHSEFGSRKVDLQAQMFGGASPMNLGKRSVGLENVAVGRAFLKNLGIRLVSEDVGGHLGRKILFDTATGQAVILKVQQLRSDDWVKKIGNDDNQQR